MILDVSNKHEAPTPSDDRDGDIVNFADIFQGEDLGVKNLAFERENKNDKIEGEDKVIKNEK